ncbi:MAG: cupredoxin domain-containing protein [Candidatus Terrybacteria bacterium]|nr:cupredoxin domain-containing protein [Candidatus Terrybacteria bacterium]
MNRTTILTGLAVIATIIVAALVYLSVGPTPALAPEDGTAPDGTEFQGPVTAPPNGSETSAPGREITIRGDEFSFSPEKITADAGERLRITFVNEGNAPHTFDIDELDVHSGIVNPGGSWTVDVAAPAQPVLFRTYCAIPGHAEQGMVGQLVIE